MDSTIRTLNLVGAAGAEGLEASDAELLRECIRVINRNIDKHARRRAYYYDHVRVKDRGMHVPPEYNNVNFATGWAAKAVNALAERSKLDGFTFDGDVPDGFAAAMDANKISDSYRMALPSSLIDGVGFWAVTPNVDGSVSVNYYDACTASGIWDWKHRTLAACMVVNDFSRFGKSLAYVPSEIVLYTPKSNIVITKLESGKRNTWTAEYRANPMGEVMAVAMPYQRDNSKPFGRSRITKACMCYIDRMMEELLNAAMQSDSFSVPMKYVLGASDEQYAKMAESIHKAYRSEMLVMTVNEEGSAPSVGMLQSADMTPHIAYMNKMASLMASETSLPIATFGVESNGYTSSDALRASTDDLVVLARSVNAANAQVMEHVARMVLAVLADKPIRELDANEASVLAHFADPSMPSDAANADAMVKVVSAVPEFAGTEVFWEKLGYSEDDRRRIGAAMSGNRNAALVVDKLFGGGNADTA